MGAGRLLSDHPFARRSHRRRLPGGGSRGARQVAEALGGRQHPGAPALSDSRRATRDQARPGERAEAGVTDFVTTDEDLSGSPLWNRDLAPTTTAQRTWSTWNIAALWIGMSVVITTYTLASGMMAQGMTWWQAMVTILLGNVIVLIPMILNAHAGT